MTLLIKHKTPRIRGMGIENSKSANKKSRQSQEMKNIVRCVMRMSTLLRMLFEKVLHRDGDFLGIRASIDGFLKRYGTKTKKLLKWVKFKLFFYKIRRILSIWRVLLGFPRKSTAAMNTYLWFVKEVVSKTPRTEEYLRTEIGIKFAKRFCEVWSNAFVNRYCGEMDNLW